MSKANLREEIAREIKAQRFDVTNEGILFPRLASLVVSGEYFGRVNGGAWRKEGVNLVPIQGMAHILNSTFDKTYSKAAGHYIALFSGSTAPTPAWTAANFAAVANEIVSVTEGHPGATRPEWDAQRTATGSVDNIAAAGEITIATTGTLTVTGMAILTNNARGSTTGTLVSASLFAAARTFQNGDKYGLGYRLNLTV